MSLTVVTITKDTEEVKRIKTKIGVGSVKTAKVGETRKNTREGRYRIMGKELMGCFQAVA